jgi:hypothetical protein
MIGNVNDGPLEIQIFLPHNDDVSEPGEQAPINKRSEDVVEQFGA